MVEIPRKFYLRREELKPDTAAQNAIRHGLWMQGVELVDYVDPLEIDGMDDLGPDVGVAGYISDVLHGLGHLGISPPPLLDYPKALMEAGFMGRRIWQSTLGQVRQAEWPVFVKPLSDHKLFQGFVWSGSRPDRLALAHLADAVPVWVSEVIDFKSEHRVFILKGEVLDCRRYRGDWSQAPDRGVVLSAVSAHKGPIAHCLDFGVTGTGKTLLVEANDGFAFGPYGLRPEQYACMISARWRELCLTGTRSLVGAA